jgi:hypothetical protein
MNNAFGIAIKIVLCSLCVIERNVEKRESKLYCAVDVLNKIMSSKSSFLASVFESDIIRLNVRQNA